MIKNFTYAIIGTGGIGGYYGAKLAKSVQDVHFLFNSDYEYVLQHGLRIDSKDGDFQLSNINAYSSSWEMPKADVILIGLKTTNNDLIKSLVTPILKESTIIILIQNGLGLEEKLNRDLPNIQIGGGLAFICSEKVAPGHVCHMDFGRLILAPYSISDTDKWKQIHNDFIHAGIKAELSKDLKTSRWRKLVWNIPFNGMTVVLNTSTKELVSNESSRELIREIIWEVIKAGRACGAEMKDSYADEMIEMTLNMKPYAPSMKVDFDNNRPLEIEAIYSYPIFQARQHSQPMPKVEMLEQLLKFISKSIN